MKISKAAMEFITEGEVILVTLVEGAKSLNSVYIHRVMYHWKAL